MSNNVGMDARFVFDPNGNDVNTRLNGHDASLASKATKTHISIIDFPRNLGETDDAPRIQRAINSLTNGGTVEFEVAEYQLANTVTIPQNVVIQGQGCGRFTTGTSFRFIGSSGGTAFNFATNATAGIRLQNFKIYTKSGDPAYQNFTAINVNQAELTKFKDILIQYANIGIDISGSTNDVYLLDIDTVYIYNCANEGILLRSTGTWKQGIRIKVGDISYNNIGIHCMSGNGNTIEGDASEVGHNTTGGILIEGGTYTIKGNLWIEGSPYGIQTTGGHTLVSGDVYCIVPFVKSGGSLIVEPHQSNVPLISPAMIKNNLVAWFSFEEGTGLATYDRAHGNKGTFSSSSMSWNTDTSGYGTTIQSTGGVINIPLTLLDWTQSWTVLTLAKGVNTGNILLVKGSDGTKNIILRPYTNGCQLYVNSGFVKNFGTFPNGDATTNLNWHIIEYDATNHVMNAYSPSGKLQDSYAITMDATMNAPSLINLTSTGIYLDEFIIYNRLLSDSEIRAITQMKIPPDVNDGTFKLLSSPDGSRWKQTIDNTGTTTWTKL